VHSRDKLRASELCILELNKTSQPYTFVNQMRPVNTANSWATWDHKFCAGLSEIRPMIIVHSWDKLRASELCILELNKTSQPCTFLNQMRSVNTANSWATWDLKYCAGLSEIRPMNIVHSWAKPSLSELCILELNKTRKHCAFLKQMRPVSTAHSWMKWDRWILCIHELNEPSQHCVELNPVLTLETYSWGGVSKGGI